LKAKIVVLAGDGIGPEVTAEAVRVLQATAKRFGHEFTFSDHSIGGQSIDAFGTALTDEALAACKSADAVLLGAVGGPKWDDPTAPTRPEDGLLALRKGLGLYANLRPVKPHPALIDASPIKPEKFRGADLIVVRELTGGLYFGKPKGRERINGHVRAVDTLEYHDNEIERILRLAFWLSKNRRKKLTSVDKANVLETSRLWRQTANALAAEYPDVTLEHMLVDTASMRLVSSPLHFDVLVTENMFGDILTDEASVLAGSMGLLPSASLGDEGPGLYEPIHGSAPDIAGKGIANPVGSILSAGMLLRHSLHLECEAVTVESAVNTALDEGYRTVDLGGRHSTQQMADAIIEHLSPANASAPTD
jgi:3-isopropylmalate dehydrogenase